MGYLITHIPGALLAQKFGGKWTLGLGVLATTICNAAIPIGVKYGEWEIFINNFYDYFILLIINLGGHIALIILRAMVSIIWKLKFKLL